MIKRIEAGTHVRLLILLLIVNGCVHHANGSPTLPTGEEVFNNFLENNDIHLNTEPLCKANINLRQQFAMALSTSYESPNATVLSSSCSPTKYKNAQGTINDAWDCTIQINENNPNGDYVSSSTFVFSLTLNNKKFIPGSLRCF